MLAARVRNRQQISVSQATATSTSGTDSHRRASDPTHRAPRRWPFGRTMGAATMHRSFGVILTSGWSFTLQ